jgi:hypothetical protein
MRSLSRMSKWRGYIGNILGEENPARTQSMLDPISAWGNAEKEKWKAVQKAIPLTNRLGNFIGSIIGPAAIGLGGLLGDEMKAWRAANLERIAYKWSQKRKRRGIHPEIIKLLPFREAIGVIDAASKEDDDDVQELWARLIDNATNPDSKLEINKMHIELINSLNGIEACVLRAIFAWHDDDFRDENKQSRWKAAMKRWPKLSSDQLRLCMQNLQRLGIVAPGMTEHEILNYNTIEEWGKGVHERNIVAEFKRVIEALILELTNFSGNPMNDITIPDDPKEQFHFVLYYGLTRIGYDLWEATSENVPGSSV